MANKKLRIKVDERGTLEDVLVERAITADNAIKATQDGSGNVITETYVSNEDLQRTFSELDKCEVININITEDEIVNNTTGRITRTLSTTDGVIIFDETKECVIIVNAINNSLMFHRQQISVGSDGTANALFIAQDVDAMCPLGVTKADNEYSVIIDFEGTTYGFSYVDLLSKGGETKYELNSNDGNRHIQFREGSNILLTSQGTNQVIISATDTTYENATTTKSGLMSDIDKTKLDTVEEGAQVNTPSFGAIWTSDSSGIPMDGFIAPKDGSVLYLQEGQNISLVYNDTTSMKIAFSGTLPIANGGTGATTQSEALTNLVNGTGLVNSGSMSATDYIIFQSKGSDVLRLSVSDFKTVLGIGEPYVMQLGYSKWVETASSTDAAIAAMSDYGKYCCKIEAATHGKGIYPIVQLTYLSSFNSTSHYIKYETNIITNPSGDVYLFANSLSSNYSVIIK